MIVELSVVLSASCRLRKVSTDRLHDCCEVCHVKKGTNTLLTHLCISKQYVDNVEHTEK